MDDEPVSVTVFEGEQVADADGPLMREQRLLQDPEAVRYVWARIQRRSSPEHEQVVLQPRNTRLCWEREQGAAGAPAGFAVALFGGIDRTAVEQKTIRLDEVRLLLSRFEVLEDKRRGRGWSPTEYAPGHSTRGNAGVAAVSALVFDLDRVPPDAERPGRRPHHVVAYAHSAALARGHPAQYSSAGRASARRVAARTCSAVPEADPACKDPSRAY